MRAPTRVVTVAAAALLAVVLAPAGAGPAGAADPTPASSVPASSAPVSSVPASSAPGGVPGVSATTIRVGGVAGRTGADGPAYRHAFSGARAYFDAVNRRGGVDGRRIQLVATLDDGSDGARDVTSARELVEQRKVFAVVPVATPSFTAGGYLAGGAVPTFGWSGGAAAADWSAGPTLFGTAGSYRCLTCAQLPAAFVARQVGATRAAVLGGPAPGSAACVRGLQAALKRYGPPVAFTDASPNAPADDAAKLHGLGVDFVALCGDSAGAASVAQALRSAGTTGAHLFVTDGYAPAAAQRLGTQLDGVYSALGFLPVESAAGSSGMQEFVMAMRRQHAAPDEQALSGWLGAELFVAGLRAAGPDLTRQSVVDAVNKMTDFTAGGILPGVDWSAGGHGPGRTACAAYVESTGGKYVGRFGQPGKPFVCFPQLPAPATLDAPAYR
jgi:ABC-type branched-subunit amino acid transport system substrate-binding protein